MPGHYYFFPVQRVVASGKLWRGPKYLKWKENQAGIDVPWRMMDYGHIDLAFVAADVSLVQHQTLFDFPDILSIDPRSGVPRDLDALATQGEIDALVAYLDTAGNFVPMGWATTADTRRAILRGVCGIFLFVQRATGVAGTPPTEWGVTLATTWGELSEQQKQWMRWSATSLGFTFDDPAENISMRQILKFMGDAWGSREISMGPFGNI
jgi:hypothetical protein